MESGLDKTSDYVFGPQLADFEYSGSLNKATAQGAKFALLMAMLEADCLQRPYIEPNKIIGKSLTEILAPISHYRPLPLAAHPDYWQQVAQTEKLVQAGHVDDARLWLCMHPEPLALQNDVKFIAHDILDNCALSTQRRFKNRSEQALQTDETLLFDILDDIRPLPATA
ncbi:MAG: hypothetical protein GW763_00620 [Paraglaciecola sp.]|nr:hypothetical protein [Paraglaciecola sp.]NCT46495.1 hypothetical protein [Paraglaciecola sp.]